MHPKYSKPEKRMHCHLIVAFTMHPKHWKCLYGMYKECGYATIPVSSLLDYHLYGYWRSVKRAKPRRLALDTRRGHIKCNKQVENKKG